MKKKLWLRNTGLTMLFTGGADPEPGLLPDPGSGQRSQQWPESGDQRDGRLQESHTSQVTYSRKSISNQIH